MSFVPFWPPNFRFVHWKQIEFEGGARLCRKDFCAILNMRGLIRTNSLPIWRSGKAKQTNVKKRLLIKVNFILFDQSLFMFVAFLDNEAQKNRAAWCSYQAAATGWPFAPLRNRPKYRLTILIQILARSNYKDMTNNAAKILRHKQKEENLPGNSESRPLADG